MSPVLETAQAKDAQEVGVILHSWLQNTQWVPKLHTRDETIGFADSMIARGWVTVARKRNVAGFLARDAGFVHALYLSDGMRGQGIGRALIARAKAEEEMLTLWTFLANTDARQFYLRDGFQEVTRTDGSGNDEKLPDICYQWRTNGET